MSTRRPARFEPSRALLSHVVVRSALSGAQEAVGSDALTPIMPVVPRWVDDDAIAGHLVSWSVRQLPATVAAPWREAFAEAAEVASALAVGAPVYSGLVQDARDTLERMPESDRAAVTAVSAALDAYTARTDRVAHGASCAHWAARAVADPQHFVLGLIEFARIRIETARHLARAHVDAA